MPNMAAANTFLLLATVQAVAFVSYEWNATLMLVLVQRLTSETDSWEIGECNSSKCIKTRPLTLTSVATETTITKRSLRPNKGQTSPSRGRRKGKCTRATKRTESVTRSCRYRCLGKPLKLEVEPDGTPCRPSPRRRGFCFQGRCQKKHPETETPEEPKTVTPDQQHYLRPLNCSHTKKKTTSDGAVRTCSFICKTEKARFLVIEEKGTPCVGSRGKRGVCIGRICRRPPRVTTSSAAPRKRSKTRQSQTKTTPTIFLIASSLAHKPNGTPSLYATEGGSSVYRSGYPTRFEGSSESPAALRKVSTDTKTRLYPTVTASISAGRSFNPASGVHFTTREKLFFEQQGSDTNGGHAASSKKFPPKIEANKEAYSRTQEHAENTTMAPATKNTSPQGTMKFEVTSIEPHLGEEWLMESNDSFKSMLGTMPSIRKQPVTKSDTGDEQGIDQKADLRCHETSSENIVRSLTPKGYYTTSTVCPTSESASALFTVLSEASQFSRAVNNHSSATASRHIAKETSDDDMAGTLTTEVLTVQTASVDDHEKTKAEEQKTTSSARKADAVINSKEGSDTFIAKSATPVSRTEERHEMSPENTLLIKSTLAYHTEIVSAASTPMLITPRFVTTSTSAFRGIDFAHKHRAETAHQNASQIAECERFRRILTFLVDQTRPMADFRATTVTTTLDAEVDAPFIPDTKLAATDIFVAPFAQTTSADRNRLGALEAPMKGREPFIVFTDFFQKFATRSMTNSTTLPTRDNIRSLGK
ncbi:mucin-5AC-like [Dermacentor albipictus]|uniref:mucin-5AC-like n=1 Tax=Dermacentor albipictus TaxID=60249 RepID=UPI0038FCCF72